jgi:hypothetical protein
MYVYTCFDSVFLFINLMIFHLATSHSNYQNFIKFLDTSFIYDNSFLFILPCGEWIMRSLWELDISTTKLLTFREVGTQGRFLLLQCHGASQRTVAPPPCLPLDIKDLLKEDAKGFFMGFDWLPAGWMMQLAVCVSTRAAFWTENFIHRL